MWWKNIGMYPIEYGDEAHVRENARIPYVNEGRCYRVVLSYEGYAHQSEPRSPGLVGEGFPITGHHISKSNHGLELFLKEKQGDRIYVVMQKHMA